jgi:hypothetical protein
MCAYCARENFSHAFWARKVLEIIGGQGRNRTADANGSHLGSRAYGLRALGLRGLLWLFTAARCSRIVRAGHYFIHSGKFSVISLKFNRSWIGQMCAKQIRGLIKSLTQGY